VNSRYSYTSRLLCTNQPSLHCHPPTCIGLTPNPLGIRYIAAYEAETIAFIDSIEAGPSADAPITGEDGVVALAMAIAAGK